MDYLFERHGRGPFATTLRGDSGQHLEEQPEEVFSKEPVAPLASEEHGLGERSW